MGIKVSTAVLILAKDNIRGFQQALFSWHSVKDIEACEFVVSLAPSEYRAHMIEEAEEFVFHRDLTRFQIISEDDDRPYEDRLQKALQALWDQGFDIVWEAAEDELVAEDILQG